MLDVREFRAVVEMVQEEVSKETPPLVQPPGTTTQVEVKADDDDAHIWTQDFEDDLEAALGLLTDVLDAIDDAEKGPYSTRWPARERLAGPLRLRIRNFLSQWSRPEDDPICGGC